MNILPPLLLDRSCLVEKMKKLSPVIDQLEWINTNDTAFRAYWSYYANGCKKRQQDIRQRIEQNADFVQHIKSKKAASFLKILTQDKAPLVNDSPANNNHNNNTRISEKADIPDDAIYEQFFECFRTPIESGTNCNCNCNCNIKCKREKRKREKPSPIIWQQKAADAWKRLQNSRNPYDIAQIIEQLKRLEQQRSSSQRTPFADRYKNITMKYVARKPLDIVSMPIDVSKQKKTKKMRRKPTENKPDNEQRKRRLQRKRRATIPHVKYDYPREQRPSEDEAIKNLLQLKRSTYTEVPIRRDTTPYTKPQRDEASLPQLKSITLKKVAQLYEIPTLPETQEKRYRRSKGRRIKRAAKRVTKRPKQKLNNVPQSEAFQLRTTPTYLEIPTIKPRKVHTIRRALAKVSTKRNKQKPSVKYRSFRIPLNLLEKRERLVKEEAVKVKSWYKEFLKHVKDIPSHILSPHSSAIGSPSLSSKKKKQMQKLQKLIQKYETHYDDVSQQEIQNVIDKLKELEKRNPLVGELIERMQGIQSADSIDSSEFGTPDLTPYQTMDTNRRSILSRVSHLSYKRYSARAKRTKMHSIQSFDIKSNENILRKKRGKKGKPWLNLRDSKLFLETYRKNRLLSTLKQERLSAYASLLEAERQTLQLRHSSDTSDAEDESPVDQLSKSIVSLKTVASKNSSISIRDAQHHRPYQPFTRATLSKLNKNYEYRNPYSRASFIGRISDIFGQASIDIQNRLLQQESLPTAATTLPMETLKMQYLLRRQELEPLGQRERPGPTPRDEWNLKEQRSSTPKIEEPKPLYISELVAEFLKNRSIQKIFKNAYPQIFQIQQEAKAKELKQLSLGNQTKCVTRKCRKQHATMKSQPMKPKTCINCAICKQLQSHLNKSIAHPYMLQMQCERKKWELHAYYKQMMLRNCQLNKQHKQQQYTAACCMLPLCPCQSVKLSSS